MSNYLLRTEKINDSGGDLLLFTDYDYGDERTAGQSLNSYLKHLILLNHYAGTGPLIKAFWRWNEDDTVQELELKMTAESPELEGDVDQYYRVFVKGTRTEIIRFAVRI